MNELFKKDFEMLNQHIDYELLPKDKPTIFYANGYTYLNYPTGIEKNIKYLKIINNYLSETCQINLENMINLEYLELPYFIEGNIQLCSLDKLRTLVVTNTVLKSFEISNNIPQNLENLILITDLKSAKSQLQFFHFPKIKLDNLPIMLKRIIFYSSIQNKELKIYIKKNMNDIKIPFGCKVFVDNTPILES